MKSKLCLFLIMFLIWCLFDLHTPWILYKLRFIPSDSTYFHPIYFLAAFVFSAFAAIWPGYFKRVLVLILVIEFCWLLILLIQGIENNPGFVPLVLFNGNFFVLDGYLITFGAFWGGYWLGRLGLSFDLVLLVTQISLISLSIILAWAIHRLSIWLTEAWIGEKEFWV